MPGTPPTGEEPTTPPPAEPAAEVQETQAGEKPEEAAAETLTQTQIKKRFRVAKGRYDLLRQRIQALGDAPEHEAIKTQFTEYKRPKKAGSLDTAGLLAFEAKLDAFEAAFPVVDEEAEAAKIEAERKEKLAALKRDVAALNARKDRLNQVVQGLEKEAMEAIAQLKGDLEAAEAAEMTIDRLEELTTHLAALSAKVEQLEQQIGDAEETEGDGSGAAKRAAAAPPRPTAEAMAAGNAPEAAASDDGSAEQAREEYLDWFLNRRPVINRLDRIADVTDREIAIAIGLAVVDESNRQIDEKQQQMDDDAYFEYQLRALEYAAQVLENKKAAAGEEAFEPNADDMILLGQEASTKLSVLVGADLVANERSGSTFNDFVVYGTNLSGDTEQYRYMYPASDDPDKSAFVARQDEDGEKRFPKGWNELYTTPEDLESSYRYVFVPIDGESVRARVLPSRKGTNRVFVKIEGTGDVRAFGKREVAQSKETVERRLAKQEAKKQAAEERKAKAAEKREKQAEKRAEQKRKREEQKAAKAEAAKAQKEAEAAAIEGLAAEQYNAVFRVIKRYRPSGRGRGKGKKRYFSVHAVTEESGIDRDQVMLVVKKMTKDGLVKLNKDGTRFEVAANFDKAKPLAVVEKKADGTEIKQGMKQFVFREGKIVQGTVVGKPVEIGHADEWDVKIPGTREKVAYRIEWLFNTEEEARAFAKKNDIRLPDSKQREGKEQKGKQFIAHEGKSYEVEILDQEPASNADKYADPVVIRPVGGHKNLQWTVERARLGDSPDAAMAVQEWGEIPKKQYVFFGKGDSKEVTVLQEKSTSTKYKDPVVVRLANGRKRAVPRAWLSDTADAAKAAWEAGKKADDGAKGEEKRTEDTGTAAEEAKTATEETETTVQEQMQEFNRRQAELATNRDALHKLMAQKKVPRGLRQKVKRLSDRIKMGTPLVGNHDEKGVRKEMNILEKLEARYAAALADVEALPNKDEKPAGAVEADTAPAAEAAEPKFDDAYWQGIVGQKFYDASTERNVTVKRIDGDFVITGSPDGGLGAVGIDIPIKKDVWKDNVLANKLELQEEAELEEHVIEVGDRYIITTPGDGRVEMEIAEISQDDEGVEHVRLRGAGDAGVEEVMPVAELQQALETGWDADGRHIAEYQEEPETDWESIVGKRYRLINEEKQADNEVIVKEIHDDYVLLEVPDQPDWKKPAIKKDHWEDLVDDMHDSGYRLELVVAADTAVAPDAGPDAAAAETAPDTDPEDGVAQTAQDADPSPDISPDQINVEDQAEKEEAEPIDWDALVGVEFVWKSDYEEDIEVYIRRIDGNEVEFGRYDDESWSMYLDKEYMVEPMLRGTHEYGEQLEKLEREKSIIDIPERKIRDMMGSKLNDVIDLLVEPSRAGEAQVAMQHIFANDIDRLTKELRPFGYTAEEFLRSWKEEQHVPFLQGLSSWVEFERRKQDEASMTAVDRVRISGWQRTKQVLAEAAPVMGLSVAAGTLASLATAGAVLPAAVGAATLGRFLKKKVKSIRDWTRQKTDAAEAQIAANKEAKIAEKRQTEAFKQRLRERLDGMQDEGSGRAYDDLSLALSAMLSQSIRNSSHDVLQRERGEESGRSANAELLRGSMLTRIAKEKQSAVEAGDASAESRAEAQAARLDVVVDKLYATDANLVAELLEKDPAILTMLKGIDAFKNVDFDAFKKQKEEGQEEWSEAKLWAGAILATAVGAGVGYGIQSSPEMRMVLGALAGGYIGVKFGHIRDRESREKAFIADITNTIKDAEEMITDMEEGVEATRSGSHSGLTDVATSIRLPLTLSLLDSNPLLKMRAENVVRRIEHRLYEGERHETVEQLLTELDEGVNELLEEKSALKEDLSKGVGVGGKIAWGIAGAAAGVTVALWGIERSQDAAFDRMTVSKEQLAEYEAARAELLAARAEAEAMRVRSLEVEAPAVDPEAATTTGPVEIPRFALSSEFMNQHDLKDYQKIYLEHLVKSRPELFAGDPAEAEALATKLAKTFDNPIRLRGIRDFKLTAFEEMLKKGDTAAAVDMLQDEKMNRMARRSLKAFGDIRNFDYDQFVADYQSTVLDNPDSRGAASMRRSLGKALQASGNREIANAGMGGIKGDPFLHESERGLSKLEARLLEKAPENTTFQNTVMGEIEVPAPDPVSEGAITSGTAKFEDVSATMDQENHLATLLDPDTGRTVHLENVDSIRYSEEDKLYYVTPADGDGQLGYDHEVLFGDDYYDSPDAADQRVIDVGERVAELGDELEKDKTVLPPPTTAEAAGYGAAVGGVVGAGELATEALDRKKDREARTMERPSVSRVRNRQIDSRVPVAGRDQRFTRSGLMVFEYDDSGNVLDVRLERHNSYTGPDFVIDTLFEDTEDLDGLEQEFGEAANIFKDLDEDLRMYEELKQAGELNSPAATFIREYIHKNMQKLADTLSPPPQELFKDDMLEQFGFEVWDDEEEGEDDEDDDVEAANEDQERSDRVAQQKRRNRQKARRRDRAA